MAESQREIFTEQWTKNLSASEGDRITQPRNPFTQCLLHTSEVSLGWADELSPTSQRFSWGH